MTASDIQPWLDRLVAACLPDERVTAVLLVGSHAAGRADGYSDIDVGLVTTDAGHEAVIADLPVLVRALGDPLFDDDFDDPTNRHVIYADGTCLEILVWAEGSLDLDGPSRVLFDRTGAVARATLPGPADAQQPAGDDASPEALQRRVVAFWHDVEHLVTALGRGQTWWAYGQLDELRRLCLDLARIADGVEIEPGEAYWKVDQAVSPARLTAMEATISSRDLASIGVAAVELLAVYRGLAMDLAAAHRFEYPTALDRLVSGRLDRLG